MMQLRRVSGLLLLLALFAVPALAGEPSPLKTERDRVNYAIGTYLIGNFKQQGVDIDLDTVILGMKDAYAGRKLLLNDEELRTAITIYQAKVRQKRGQLPTPVALDNKAAGEAFLAANAKREGVVTTASGLQYKVMNTGDGKRPSDDDTVEYRYRAALIDGTEVENSSRPEGKAPPVKVSAMPPGLREAVQLMPIGSQWQLFVPPRLAYGDHGKDGPIGPNVVLIYEVELLTIK